MEWKEDKQDACLGYFTCDWPGCTETTSSPYAISMP
jgi:hypothetical protein